MGGWRGMGGVSIPLRQPISDTVLMGIPKEHLKGFLKGFLKGSLTDCLEDFFKVS